MLVFTAKKRKKNKIINKTLEELVPQNHLVRKLENCIDFRFIEKEVKPLYSPIGAPSIPPVVLFKIAFINIIFNIHSMRKTAEECQINVAYRQDKRMKSNYKIFL